MGANLGSLDDYLPSTEPTSRPELGFLQGLGQFLAEDKGSAPAFLLQADYSRTVNIAVAGNSGVGKSLLVNTIRGVRPDDPTWAPVGVTETTQEPRWYEFPGESAVRLWDMEGAGATCTWDDYTGNIGLRYFDVVLLLCCTRLTDSDVAIVRELENQSIPFFFVRTKLDEDIKNNEADCGRSAEETEESIRCDLQMCGITSPYLVNARLPDKHDFPKLLKDIVIRLEIFERKVKDVDEKAPEAEAQPVQPEATPEPLAPKTAAVSATAAPEAPEKTAEEKVSTAPADKPATLDAKAASPAVTTSSPVTASSPDSSSDLYFLPKGKHIEPIEALYAEGGHWLWFEDEGFHEWHEAEYGAIGAFMMKQMQGTPEHTYRRRSDGNFDVKVKNGWTSLGTSFRGKDSVEQILDLNHKDNCLKFSTFGNKKMFCRTRSYIEGGRLISESTGHAEGYTDGIQAPHHFRLHRFVCDNMYWCAFENVIKSTTGFRRFKRYPFYRIVNETGKDVTVKTYSSSAIFSTPNTTATVEPGSSCIDLQKPDVGMEQMVFTLPNRTTYTISQVEPFETYCIRQELFS